MEKSKELTLDFLKNEMVDIYDQYFTSEEIDNFISFYKSKSGQKYLNQLPDIQKESMFAMMAKFQNNLQQSLIKVFRK